nr:MAG TPA: hypothetical protein [Caudoviricetes sp.]
MYRNHYRRHNNYIAFNYHTLSIPQVFNLVKYFCHLV